MSASNNAAIKSTPNGVKKYTSLPAFTSIADQPQRQFNYTESSSKASSSRSGQEKDERIAHSDHESLQSSTRPTPSVGEGRHQVEYSPAQLTNGVVRRSRSKRSSGGFLLDSSPISSRLSQTFVSPQDSKGKRRSDILPRSTSLRLAQNDGPHLSPLSLGGSSATLQGPMKGMTSSIHSHGSSVSDQNKVGFDTDPAQIVDMALRLNEGRRRQASSLRQVSGQVSDRRIVSQATTQMARSSPAPQPIIGSEKYLDSPPNREIRTADSSSTPQRSMRTSIVQDAMQNPLSPASDARTTSEQMVEDVMYISRATQHRIDRARTYFELAYEHRRLLPHLPPLQVPGASHIPDARVYNPLQYVRNRKLRFRERAPIDAENDGWHDVVKVRTWVDAVVSSHTEVKHSPLECVRLPPLSLREDDLSQEDEGNAAKRRQKSGRPRRPKSDWQTHPGDLIADECWTEQGLNKQKLYNKDNEPLYPGDTQFIFSGWRDRRPVDVPRSLKESPESQGLAQSAKRRRSSAAVPDMPVFESAYDQTSKKRGSLLNKVLHGRKRFKSLVDDDVFAIDSDNEVDKARIGNSDFRASDTLSKPIPSAGGQEGIYAMNVDGHKSPSNDSYDHAKMLRHLRRSTISSGKGVRRAWTKNIRRRQNRVQSETDDETDENFLDYHSTAPGTPDLTGFPSITGPFSPAQSRSPSPYGKTKYFFHGSMKDKASVAREKIDQTDFAATESNFTRASTHASRDASRQPRRSIDWTRNSSPMAGSRGPSPMTRQKTYDSEENAGLLPAVNHRTSTVSKVSSRTTESEKKRKGVKLLKGGRIAELVGNEVSRVGNYVLKRNVPRDGVFNDGGSTDGYETSDTDGSDSKPEVPYRMISRNGRPNPVHMHSSPDVRSPVSIQPSDSSSPSQNPGTYHISGLPSFTSPFDKDRAAQHKDRRGQSPGGTPQSDDSEYSDDRARIRPRAEIAKSSRLDLPKLVTSGPNTSYDPRRKSYGFGMDFGKVRSASDTFNNAINGTSPERERERRKSRFPSMPFGPDSDLSLLRSSSARDTTQPSKAKIISTNDLYRVRGLLVATAVKATNIELLVDSIPNHQSAFLQRALTTAKTSQEIIKDLPPQPRRTEPVIAAKQLFAHLAYQNTTFSSDLDHFTQVTTTTLQKDVQKLEDRVDSDLFPRLRDLGDRCGLLAQQLTTTSTLALNTVDDELLAVRKLGTRGGLGRVTLNVLYKLAEWGVVTLLWLIWFVATFVRLGIRLVRGVWRVIMWLLFLR